MSFDEPEPETEKDRLARSESGADRVLSALRHSNWDDLRKASLLPGGFGEARRDVWPFLLQTHRPNIRNRPGSPDSVLTQSQLIRRKRKAFGTVQKSHEDENEKMVGPASEDNHPDERQIKLDTDRSFVFYPVDSMKKREELQTNLNHLIVSVFRRRPKLSYFQGYHDIITVLFLTLPDEDQLPCAEQLSLHRLRDSMGQGLEPMMGLLRILQRLLRLADPDLAALLEQNTPLPYFALSNLLTLFSHDVPTLPQIQHVFDFLLCRPPIMSVYLAVAFALTRKEEAERLKEEEEEGMLHSLMSNLPELVDGEDEPLKVEQDGENGMLDDTGPDLAEIKQEDAEFDEKAPGLSGTTDSAQVANRLEQSMDEMSEFEKSFLDETTSLGSGGTFSGASSFTHSVGDHVKDESGEDSQKPESPISSLPNSLSASSISQPEQQEALPEDDEKFEIHTSPPPSPTFRVPYPHRRRILLTSLLKHADELYALYPPTHPALAVRSIMGPQSVVFTWSEDPSQIEGDDKAEEMVLHTELTVLPYIEPDQENVEPEGGPQKGRAQPWKPGGFAVERRIVVAGVVVALGIAVAMYGIRASGPNWAVRAGLERGRTERDWRKAGRWAGSALLGTGERLFDVFGL